MTIRNVYNILNLPLNPTLSSYIRQLLEKSLSEEMFVVLCNQVGEKNISAWKAAEKAGVSLRKMMEELKKRNVSGYDEQAIKEDIEYALD